jgi:hypothetical protein
MASPVVNTQQDPIVYWTGMQATGHPLARMALDFLSIPGTLIGLYLSYLSTLFDLSIYTASSTDVERAFSKGGLTVSRFRHSLSDDSTRFSAVVGTWTKIPNAIPHEEIVSLFTTKSSRGPSKRAKITPAAGSDSDIQVVE